MSDGDDNRDNSSADDCADERARRPVPLPPGVSPFERHVFVCVRGKACPDQGAVELHAELKRVAAEHCGKVRLRVNKSGCLAQCGHGPVIAVYPEGVWYAGVTAGDVPELIEEHLIGGRPVERLLFRGHHAGPNVC